MKKEKSVIANFAPSKISSDLRIRSHAASGEREEQIYP